MKTSRPAAAFATASILLIVACTSATGRATPSSPTSTPTPPPATATSSPRADPTSSPAPSATAQPTPLPVSTHQPADFEPSFTLAAPSDWRIVDESTEHYVVAGPDSVGTIVLQANPVIASDANGCEGLAAVDGATTVDGIVASVLTNSKLVTSTSVMTVDGHEGQVIDVALDPLFSSPCNWSGGQKATLILTTQNPPGPFFGILNSERVRLILLDVGDDVVLIAVSAADAAMFDELLQLAIPIIESVQFTS